MLSYSGTAGRRGFSLIELTVVIAIIGVLLALLVPGVQMAREAARRTQCQNHLRQLAFAAQLHENIHGHFPTGGWGFTWVGEPDGGYGEGQPGGWVYNVLPFIEQTAVRELGSGLDDVARREALTKMLRASLSVLNCPARRNSRPYPYTSGAVPRNADKPRDAAKSDYAINGGDKFINTGTGPLSMSPEDVEAYEWPVLDEFTGIAFVRTKIRPAEITDGLSNTLLIAEKYVPADQYLSCENQGDDQSMYLGEDADIRRWTIAPPLPDSSRQDSRREFGGPHASLQAAFCDGSARSVSYTVDADVFRAMGNRKDGE